MIAIIPKYPVDGVCKCGATGCPDVCYQEGKYYHNHKEKPKPKVKKQKSYSKFLPKKWNHKFTG